MKKPIDARSLLAGLLLGAVVLAAVAAAVPNSGPVGRYQAYMADGKALIIDTITGQAWMDTYHAKVKSDPEFFNAKTAAPIPK